MTILFATDNFLPAVNGIVNQVVTIREELRKRGHRVIIVAPKYNHEPQEADVLRLPSISFPFRPGDRITMPFVPRIEQALLKIPIDIIHSHLFLTGFLGTKIAAKKHIPKVVTLHTLANQLVSWIVPWAVRISEPLTNLVYRFYFNQYDVAIAPSAKAAEALKKAGVKTPIKIIPNGINLEIFKNTSGDKFCQKFGIDRKKYLLVIVGKLDPGKNVDLGVLAMKKVKERIPQVKLAIVGDGPCRKAIQGLIQKMNLTPDVFMTGFIDQEMVASANKAASVVLLTSDIDVLPTVAIEAVACGKPIVAIRDKSIAGIVKHKKNGLLAAKDPTAIANEITRILQNPALAKEYGFSSLEIAKKFSVQSCVDQLEVLYQGLINNYQEKIGV